MGKTPVKYEASISLTRQLVLCTTAGEDFGIGAALFLLVYRDASKLNSFPLWVALIFLMPDLQRWQQSCGRRIESQPVPRTNYVISRP